MFFYCEEYSETCHGDVINIESGKTMHDLMNCCQTKPGGCLVNEGDCDQDYECSKGLRCGHKNCNWFNSVLWNISVDVKLPPWMTPDCCEGKISIFYYVTK